MRHPKIRAGDAVAYRGSYLRSIGDYSYDRASMRGRVLHQIANHELSTVKWNDGRTIVDIRTINLWPADKLHLEPA